MSLPRQLQNSMLPTELEFIASNELVQIRPLVKMDQIKFITKMHGPFVGGRAVEVPLWVAVNLKLKKKCNIVPPDWLNVEFLQDKLIVETDERLKDEFAKFPFRYAEIAKVLLDVASDNLEKPDEIRKLLKDIRETRQSKIRDALLNINPISLQMNNVSAMEINEVRPFFSRAMGTLIQLRPETANGGNEGEEGAGIYT